MPVLTLPQVDSSSMRAKALVFEDESSRALLARIARVAPSDATVLVYGETGTGKEIVARHVHALSRRHDRPFVAVNCGALSESLVESELFGHERGAFTGALGARAGWFEAAHGGSLFLDEIGDLPLAMQVKLLRILQEGEVVRLGSRSPIAVDVRLIAATNVRLEQAVSAGRFREDLFYRLNVATLSLSPLRERRSDILPLTAHFIETYAARLGMAERPQLSAAAEQALLEHGWPGNIRELENVIHHALLVCRGQRIEPEDLRLTVLSARVAPAPAPAPAPLQPSAAGVSLDAALGELFEQNLPDLHAHIEERVIRAAYAYCNRNQVHTARLLGISRNVVRARLIECGELPGVPRRSSAPPARSAEEVLSIGYQRYGLLPLLKATGALERTLAKQGVRVQWREFPSGIPLIEALQSAPLGLGLVGEGPPVFAQAARIPIVYLAAEAPAPEREAIVVHADSPIHSVSQLRGKTVMLSRGSNVHYFLILALEEAKVDYRDIEVVYVSPEHAHSMFESRRVDAWATWDPFLGSVRELAAARVLRDARGLTENTSYYIAHRDFADQRRDLIEIFLSEVNSAARWASENGRRALELLGSQLDVRHWNPDVFGGQLGAWPIDEDHMASQQAVADTFLRVQLISRPVAVAEAGWPQPVTGAQPRSRSYA